jgi:hypothetical protein
MVHLQRSPFRLSHPVESATSRTRTVSLTMKTFAVALLCACRGPHRCADHGAGVRGRCVGVSDRTRARGRERARVCRPWTSRTEGDYQSFEEDPSVIYVRQEAPSLLWRSIVQGLGLAIGFFFGTVLVWLDASFLVLLLFHQAIPGVPTL